MNLGILVSGHLGRVVLGQLIDKYSVSFVCTDASSEHIMEFCKENNLRLFVGNPRKGSVRSFVEGEEIDVLISVNYLYLIEKDLIELPRLYAINVHGSLLPKYRGRTPHVWAIINGENKTGITAHTIDIGCDTGKIIRQIEVPILDNDTGADVLDKFHKLYPTLVFKVLEMVSNGEIELTKQDEAKATYFGKRTPEDGQIDWNWSKERIRNWVRAQAHPYPGAFTYFNEKKVIIDQVAFSDIGFDYQDENGLLLNTNPLVVKTSNGALVIKKTRAIKSRLERDNKFTYENRR